MAREVITDTNLAPVVQIFVWFCLVLAILTVIARLCIKVKVVNQTGMDDVFIVLSLLFAISESITISVAASNGLGATAHAFKDANESTRQKTTYASSILFILSSCFSKLSLLLFVRTLSPASVYQTLGLYLGLVISLWAISGVFIIAFQCSLPDPWVQANGSCLNKGATGSYIGIVNALTDIALIVLPVSIILPIQISLSRKFWVVSAFSARLSVVAAIIGQIVYVNRLSQSTDRTLDQGPLAVTTQLAQTLSIATTCAVYLKPLLDSLESGFISVGDLRRQGSEGFGYIPKGSDILNVLSSFSRREPRSKSNKSKTTTKTSGSIAQGRSAAGLPIELDQNGPKVPPEAHHAGWDDDDATSRSRIVQTNGWAVRYDDDRQSNHGPA